MAGQGEIYVGCAGWNVPASHGEAFLESGSHLERYASVFSAVEINTSFYRTHRPQTYARWASSVPQHFRFAVKVPKQITHVERLTRPDLIDEFLEGVTELGSKLGPLLIQLPPSLRFDLGLAERFFGALRDRYAGAAVFEPRHASWFDDNAEQLLLRYRVARVAADPAPAAGAGEPAGDAGVQYYRLHGSPRMYYSSYDHTTLERLAGRLARGRSNAAIWCIFDNTAEFFATANALQLLKLIGD